jgi:hypothetical protein
VIDYVIEIYDSKFVDTTDDYTIIKTKQQISNLIIPTFEESVDNENIKQTFKRYELLLRIIPLMRQW